MKIYSRRKNVQWRKGKIQLINHQGLIARSLKIINESLMPKCLSKINTFKYRACLCVAHKKYHRSASSFAFGTQRACVPRNEIFHITSVLPFQTQALLPFFYFISSGLTLFKVDVSSLIFLSGWSIHWFKWGYCSALLLLYCCLHLPLGLLVFALSI